MIRAAIALMSGGSVVLAAWDLATSRLGLVVIASTLAFGSGWHVRGERCDAAAIRADLAAARADLTAARIAESLARGQAAGLEAADAANRNRIDDLSRDLKSRKGRACGLSDDDARRLRDIR